MAAKSTGNKKPKCGLCGRGARRTIPLTKTECCDNWICDDEHTYVLFSYARNSCSRNHRRYTLCAYHFNEKHEGKWQDCQKCKDEFETPDYVAFATEYNFEPLQNIEKVTVSCTNCGATADDLAFFPLKCRQGSTTSYYCVKEKCQKAGLAH